MEWISVKTKLPKKDERVLVWNYELDEYDKRDEVTAPGVRLGRLTYMGDLSPEGCMGFNASTIYWMPLPEPPK